MSRTSASALLLTVLCLAAVAVRSHVVVHRDQFAYGSDELQALPSSGRSSDRPTDHARIARQLVHTADWTSFGTNSANKDLAGFPMVNIISVADSKRAAPSTGDIFFLLTDLDYTGQDLHKANKLTMLFTQETDLNCSRRGVDPMEPTCARVIISGSAQRLDKDSEDYAFGYEAFVDRHPAASNWIAEHDFYLCKVKFSSIIVLDWYGGPHHVTVDDYFAHNDRQPDSADEDQLTIVGDRHVYHTTVNAPRTGGPKHSVRIHVDRATNDIVIDV